MTLPWTNTSLVSAAALDRWITRRPDEDFEECPEGLLDDAIAKRRASIEEEVAGSDLSPEDKALELADSNAG
jgi:hypothetical protein